MFGGLRSRFGWRKEVERVCVCGGEKVGAGAEHEATAESERRNKEKRSEGSTSAAHQTLDNKNPPRDNAKCISVSLAVSRNILWLGSILSLSISLSGYVSRYPFQVGYSCPAHPRRESG